MRDYADRIHTLRHCASEPYVGKCGDCPMDGIELCQDIVMREAADAIEELLKENAELDNSGRVLMAAFARLKEKVPQWISVEERLPETYRVVLVIKDHPVDYLHGYEFACRFNNGEWSGNSRKVLYWMYLPEPPAGGELNGD